MDDSSHSRYNYCHEMDDGMTHEILQKFSNAVHCKGAPNGGSLTQNKGILLLPGPLPGANSDSVNLSRHHGKRSLRVATLCHAC